MEPARRASVERLVEGDNMDTNFLKAHAERCRGLAENADEFTKRRLPALAASYDKRLTATGPQPPPAFSKHRSISKTRQNIFEPRFTSVRHMSFYIRKKPLRLSGFSISIL